MENRFNLIDCNWIPIETVGNVSLSRIFSDFSLEKLGGTPIQRFSLIKLFLAIAQRAITPADDKQWKELETRGLADKCMEYLGNHHELFYLYGEKPFLQFNGLKNPVRKGDIESALQPKDIGGCTIPDLPSENNSILNSFQLPSNKVSDAEKALFIVSVMNYSLGGKRVDRNSPIFSAGYFTKKSSGKPGPSLGNYNGYLQTCFLGASVIETIWLNMLTKEDISQFRAYQSVPFIPPWEKMPEGEDDATAKEIKNGYMGALCAMSKFVYLKDDGIIYTDGIQYPSHKEGWREPFMTYSPSGKIAWVDNTRRPWRNINSLLELSMIGTSEADALSCPQISLLFRRNRKARNRLWILSGGLQVRASSGDQSVKQTDDFVDDITAIDCSVLSEEWYFSLKNEMSALEKISKQVYASVASYYKYMGSATGKEKAGKATFEFWNLCETRKQDLFSAVKNEEDLKRQRAIFAGFAERAFSDFCPNDTAMQMCAWVNNKPNLYKYKSIAKEVDNDK